LLAAPLAAQLQLDPPGQRQFVLDHAKLLSPASVSSIQAVCNRVLTEKAIPIVVVTIESMAQHGGAGMTIEGFATTLYNQWGVGHPTVHGQPWNKGVLLLVSEGDRKARIELGAGWAATYDAECQVIMDEHIIPRFKEGKFAEGVGAGVDQLAAMTRGEKIPKAPIRWEMIALFVGGIALLIWTAISLSRSGRRGWAWVVWGVIFTILGYVLIAALSGKGRGGGFSGGSFGGGSSGGGGASGSW
jgi:uncharacterized protein